MLQIKLVEVPVPAPSAKDLQSVVRRVEMPSKVQVEIGWGCLCLARAMQEQGFKVTFSGDGSDELWASYGFSYHGIQQRGWYGYRQHAILDQHRKNFARCNKIFMSYGVESRFPFLNPGLVEFALSLPPELVRLDGHPKGILARAMEGLLPEGLLKRNKMAFQDGLGIKEAMAGVAPDGDPARFYREVFQQQYGCKV